MNNEQNKFIELIKSFLTGEKTIVIENNDITFLKKLYDISLQQSLTHLIAQSLSINNINIVNEKLSEDFFSSIVRAMSIRNELDGVLSKLNELFEKNKIPHINLKGSVIKDYYPESWMRISSDIDILVKENDLQRSVSLCKSIGFTVKEETDYNICLVSKNGIYVEIHFELNDGNKPIGINWEQLSLQDGYKYRYNLTDDIFYLYHIAHMAKHFKVGGCGIRPFVDLWYINKNYPKPEKLLKEYGLLTFSQSVNKLCDVWFGNAKSDELCENMADYLFSAGVFGNLENRLAVNQAHSGGNKAGYIFKRALPPYETMCNEYPILKKRKVLLPYYYIKRISKAIFVNKLQFTKTELNIMNSIDGDKAKTVNNLIKKLEI